MRQKRLWKAFNDAADASRFSPARCRREGSANRAARPQMRPNLPDATFANMAQVRRTEYTPKRHRPTARKNETALPHGTRQSEKDGVRTEPPIRGNGSPMTTSPTVYVVDPDEAIRRSVANLAGIMNLRCEPFATGDDFLESLDPACPGCLVTEIRVPGTSGLQIQQALIQRGVTLPVIFLSNHACVAIAVHAMRAGAVQFFEKPFREDELWGAIARPSSSITSGGRGGSTRKRWKSTWQRSPRRSNSSSA